MIKSLFRLYLISMILNVLFQIVSSTCVLAKDIKIIVHSDVQDIISVNDIRNIFLGKKTQWTNNSRIRFVLLTEEQTYRTFIKHYIRKTLYQYRNYWRKKVFTGTGMMPIMYGSCDQCVDYVIRTKGAISFVPANYTVSDGVKEIILDY